MHEPTASAGEHARGAYVRTVGPRLRVLLLTIFGLVAVLSANSVYLASVTFLEWWRGVSYQNYFYLVMFGLHLVLGLLLVGPMVVFGLIHLWKARTRRNRRAIQAGYLLFALAVIVLGTGAALMRVGSLDLKNPALRSATYWAHVVSPVLVIWLYVLHRLAGPRLKWGVGWRWGLVTGLLVVASVGLHSRHPRLNQTGPAEGTKYFEPSLARTARTS